MAWYLTDRVEFDYSNPTFLFLHAPHVDWQHIIIQDQGQTDEGAFRTADNSSTNPAGEVSATFSFLDGDLPNLIREAVMVILVFVTFIQ